MKKAIIIILLNLSIANISCENTKKETTPWYASYKKTIQVGAIVRIATFYSTPLSRNIHRLIYYRGQAQISLLKDYKYCIISTPYSIPIQMCYTIVPSLIIASIGKIIHNHSQNKKPQK